jgi:DNA helicase II / ATP-dependent DNA helicase PcrA
MLSNKNKVVIAAAGSRKTTFLVEAAIKNSDNNVLILTYTIDNLNQIKNYIIERCGLIPLNITVQTWYSFLLSECIRPYQNYIYDKKRVESLFFVNSPSARFISESNIKDHYFASDIYIYSDKMSKFAFRCNEKSDGLVIKRLEKIYDYLFIDEIQDIAGYDFDFLKSLFESQINIIVVGDNRQATYFTNNSPKHKQYKGQNIIYLFTDWERDKLCTIEYKNECYRSNQAICDFADKLYPEMPKTKSMNLKKTEHDGIFIISKNNVVDYANKYMKDLQILRHDKRTNTLDLKSINFGISKGQNYNRTLIFPTSGIAKYLKTGNIKDIGDIAKLYVAITRARYSLTFVYDCDVFFNEISKI